MVDNESYTIYLLIAIAPKNHCRATIADGLINAGPQSY